MVDSTGPGNWPLSCVIVPMLSMLKDMQSPCTKQRNGDTALPLDHHKINGSHNDHARHKSYMTPLLNHGLLCEESMRCETQSCSGDGDSFRSGASTRFGDSIPLAIPLVCLPALPPDLTTLPSHSCHYRSRPLARLCGVNERCALAVVH